MKIVFFSNGDDKFILDIIASVSAKHSVHKVVIKLPSDFFLIDRWMNWADICWFEWCDELIAYGSNLEAAKRKKIICRLHSYEAFTGYPLKVNWNNIDKIIFVSENIQNYVLNKFSISEGIVTIIPNGVDLEKWGYCQRDKGFNIAYVGYINYKKGPMLLLQAFKAIFDHDKRYKLYIAGQYQDQRYNLYFKQMVREFGLENNFFFEGWQENLDEWLGDKNFILCSSILESQNMSVMQAMAKGIKPVIHNFVGARGIYSNKFIWNTIEEAVGLITEKDYNSSEYRDFVSNKYSLNTQLEKVFELLEQLASKRAANVQSGTQSNSTDLTEDYIRLKMKEFYPYSTKDFNEYDFSTAEILLGKIERISESCDLIEYVIRNSKNVKLVISNIWHDRASNGYILPKQILESSGLRAILGLTKTVLDSKPIFINNIAGFIYDSSMKQDIDKNYLAYLWERGIPASQFLPTGVYLKIIERYCFAAKFISPDCKVLEAPCGFGYGAAYFSRLCSRVEALDIADDNINFARETYRNEKINWTKGDVTRLPYSEGEFNLYVAFEVFEHLPVGIAVEMIKEAKRVLKQNGRFIISTPNAEMRKNVKNPFHTKEYNFEEFSLSLNSVFTKVDFYSVRQFQVEPGIKADATVMVAVCEK